MKAKQYLTLGLGIVAGFGISVVGVSYASQNLVSNVKQVTPEVAKSIMLNKVPGANILEFSYDGDDKTPKYDGTLIKDNYEYEVDVNAKTGQIIKFEKEAIFTHNSNGNANNASANTQQSTTQQSTTQNNNASTTRKAYIGESKAKSIMLNKVPGATISKFYLDNDATPEYDGELIKGDYEYDISVDAVTGEIREFSKERIRNYNNPTINNSTSTNSNTNANNNVATNNNTNVNNNVAPDRQGFAIASLVLGILSIPLVCWGCVGLICGVLALIFGILGLKSSKRGLAIAGIVTGIIGLIVYVVFVIVYTGIILGGATSALS